MNTQIETLEQAAKKYVEAKEDRSRAYGMVYTAFCNAANWQKQQDEAKSIQEKIETIFDKHSWNDVKDALLERGITAFVIGIDEEGIKYKELLDSHNELLENLEKATEWIEDDFSKGLYLELINKAKNIKQ